MTSHRRHSSLHPPSDLPRALGPDGGVRQPPLAARVAAPPPPRRGAPGHRKAPPIGAHPAPQRGFGLGWVSVLKLLQCAY